MASVLAHSKSKMFPFPNFSKTPGASVVFPVLFLLSVLTHHGVSSESSSAANCVTMAMCGPDEDSADATCIAHHLPKEVPGEYLETLQDFCPELLEQHGSSLCCDQEAVMNLGEKVGLASAFIGKCPGCYRNLRVMICNLFCSPNQMQFLNLSETALVPAEVKMYASDFNGGTNGEVKEDGVVSKFYVNGGNLYLDAEFGRNIYESCKGVVVGALGGSIMDVLCGKWKAAGCNARRFFDNVGKTAAGVMSMETKITLVEKGEQVFGVNRKLVPFQFQTTKCNEPVPGEEDPEEVCSCLDCEASCPVVPPPKSSTAPTFWQKDDFLYIMLTVAGLGAVTIVAAGVVGHVAGKKKDSADFNGVGAQNGTGSNGTEMRASNGEDKEAGKQEPEVEKEHDDIVTSLLRKTAVFSAENPYRVLLPGIMIIVLLSYGNTYVTMQTDPVELWTPPGSRARLEREYFSDTFGSLYRIEQVILSAKPELKGFEYESPVEGKLEFGPVFSQKFMKAVLKLQQDVQNLKSPSGYKLSDICLKPLAPDNENCLIMGYLDWWQNDLHKLERNWNQTSDTPNQPQSADVETYLDHFLMCSSNSFQANCLGRYGGPVYPSIALGGYKKTVDGKPDYKSSSTILITYFALDFVQKNLSLPAQEWEKTFIQFMKDLQLNSSHEITQSVDIAFTTARSIEDEIEAASRGEFKTIVISYLVMFLYISINLRDSYDRSRFFVESRILLGVTGILIVLTSVTSSVGLFGYYGLPATLIIMEVIPFLVLAVGVDNIFIIVQHYQRSRRQVAESRSQHIGRIVAEVAPSMVLNSLTDSVCFFLGSLSGMPAVKALSVYAGVALIFNFCLQFTIFIAVFSLDLQRSEEGRYDVFCCLKQEPPVQKGTSGSSGGKGILYTFFKKVWAPLILSYPIRVLVIAGFFLWTCVSLALVPRISPGMDPEKVLPEDSHVSQHFKALFSKAELGLPLFFVVKDTGFHYESAKGQDLIKGGKNPYSLVGQIATAAKYPNVTYVAKPASAWLDDFVEWVELSNCCKINKTTHGFCPSSSKKGQKECASCDVKLHEGHLSPSDFDKYLPWFLRDNPSMECLKGGHALYSSAVKWRRVDKDNEKDTRLHIGATFYMSFNSVLKTSDDFTNALIEARVISDNITATLNRETGSGRHEVFPYSPIFVFYEQFTTIWRDTVVSFGISFTTVLVMTFFVLGGDLYASVIILGTIFMIVVDVGGMMYFWRITLNGVSLVNLVVAVGISVEFCTHIVHAFLVSREPSRVGRARDSLVNMGSSVLSGITLTKFGGIVVLAFARSPAFRMFYFKMYLLIVVFGAVHGLVFLPVLLSFVGPFRKGKGTTGESEK